ncbi:FAD/NAD(P)-binding domain-containing protein [Apiospora kogelbergensis]|uniref:FAD/NAD(P)-binding domain-containing protein n=1 Tax=Apiospora kogelbergensis TaxID=1337665 RepID=A0AAW0QGZ8_9PEZI
MANKDCNNETDGGGKKYRIAIIGSGPIGKLLACTADLSHPRIELVQYEAETPPLRPGFGYGLGPQVLCALRAADAALAAKLERACLLGPSWMKWWHSAAAEDCMLADVHMPDNMASKVHGWIGREALLELLDANMPTKAGPLKYGKQLTGIEEVGDSLELYFEDGTKDHVDAVFGCDGIHSAVGEEFVRGQYMFIGTKGWHVLVFPIEQGRSINIASFCFEPERQKNDLGRPPRPTKESILAYFPGRSERVDTLLNLMMDHTYQRLELFHLGELGAFTNRNVTTFGDAANAMTPHMAGSMSTGIIGVAKFVREWNARIQALPADDTTDSDITRVFRDASRAYEAAHRPLAQKIVRFSQEQQHRWGGGVTDYDVLAERFHFLWHCADDMA